MSERRHIFLSYRSTEVDFALKLAADLKNAGVNLWMDRLDISPGDDWRKSLESAVYSCAALISVLSPAYVSSKYCQRELARADRLGRPIFPVLLGTIAEAEWPLEIERQQYIDFSGWQNQTLYQHELNRLVDILKERFAAQISVIPDAETQYLTNLAAAMETQKGLAEYLEFSSEADKWINREHVRPEPHSIKFWTGHSSYTLLQPSQTSKYYRKRLYEDIAEILEKHARVVLIGDPGTGKTTTLRRLALDAVYAHQSGSENTPLPLLLDLITWDDHISLDNFIRANWSLDTDPIKLLTRGRIVLFLDGLNEMIGARTKKARTLREWLESENGPQRVIVTCRSADYHSPLHLGLPLIHVNDMDRSHIERFGTNYLGEELAQIFLAKILPKDLREDHHKLYLYQMARNPFLLSAIILIHKSSLHGEVPENLGVLLRRLIAEIWERGSIQSEMPAISFEELEMALADLAHAMIESEIGVYAPYNFALEHVGSEAIIKAARAINFITVRAGSVRFTQQHFQDYFAALAIARGSLSAKSLTPHISTGGQYVPGKWDRAVVVYSGLALGTDETLLDIARLNPFLALECIVSGINASERTIEPIVSTLIQIANTPDHDARVGTASILARINQELAIPILLEAMRSGTWDVRWAATIALQDIDLPLLSGLTDALWELEHKTQDVTDTAMRHLGPNALPTLLKLLQSDNWKMRRSAAWGLGRVRDKAALPALIHALNDEDNLVGAEAVASIGQIKDEIAIPWLMDTLRHTNWRVRKAAALALGTTGKPALNFLADSLQDEEEDVRRLAIEALKEIDDPAVETLLLEASYDPSAEVRGAAIDALRASRDGPVVQRLLECLDDTTRIKWNRKRICDIAARVLATINEPEVQAALEHWRKDEGNLPLAPKQKNVLTGSPSRSSADQAKKRLKRLAQMEEEEPESDSSSEIAASSDWESRRNAIRELKNKNEPGVIPKLTRALDDDVMQVRLAAVEVLASLSGKKALQVLANTLDDPDPQVAAAAAVRLKAGGKTVVHLLIPLLNDPDIIVRARVVELLGQLGDASAVVHLVPLLSANGDALPSGEHLRQVAARALRTIGTPEALEAIKTQPTAPETTTEPAVPESPKTDAAPPTPPAKPREILTELLANVRTAEWGDREEAAKALREYAKSLHGIRDPHLVKQLTDALQDSDWFVRWAAAEALAWFGDPAAVAPLIKILADSNWMVRVAATRALLEIGDSSAANPVAALLTDSNSTVREAAAETLGMLKNPASIQPLTTALMDKEALVRLAATVALGHISGPTVLPLLLQALTDEDGHVRWSAVQSLGPIARPEIVPQLIKRLGDDGGPYWENQKVGHLAADLLLRIGTPDAQQAVKEWQARQGVKVDKSSV